MYPFASPIMIIGGGSALWTPLMLGSALVAWWDASDTSRLTLSGSSVQSWRDKVSGRIAVPGAAPGWSASARNGKPGLNFDGVSQYLTFDTTGFPTGNGNAIASLVSGYSRSAGDRVAFHYGAPTGGASYRISIDANSGILCDLYANVGMVKGNGWTLDRAVCYTATTGSQTLYVDGRSLGSAGDSPNVTLTNGRIGADVRGGFYWAGVLQQIIICNRALTTVERQKLEGWESWVDGKSGTNLPPTHPYRNAPPTA